MTTEQREPLYASTAKPWLKYYDQKYIDMPLPTITSFDEVHHFTEVDEFVSNDFIVFVTPLLSAKRKRVLSLTC